MKPPKFKTSKEEREFWDIHDSTIFLNDFDLTKDLEKKANKECLLPATYAGILILKGLRTQTG